ncbi:AraC family transcriptional regulator [Marinifilum sp. RC60d5]|uniref:AraC family transcriptional regulator n=1 Tax=Marinifilum sp. RC60d5 TaxID=3458414 RepID=UPI0040355993
MSDPIPNLYCVSSKFDEFQVYVGSLKDIHDTNETSNSIYDIHRIEYYTLILITNGEGWHFIDYEKHYLKKGSLLFISKNQVQKFEKESELKGKVILFTDNFLQKNLQYTYFKNHVNIFNYNLYTPLLDLEETNYSDFLELIERINFEFNADYDEMKGKIIGTFLNALLLKAEKISRHKRTSFEQHRYYKLFKEFGVLLEKDLPHNKDAMFYANSLNISYKHLNETCKTICAKTAKEFISDVLVLEIKRYLSSTNLSVKEIAYKFGFDEPTNLQKIFKRKTGKTAIEFREIALNE